MVCRACVSRLWAQKSMKVPPMSTPICQLMMTSRISRRAVSQEERARSKTHRAEPDKGTLWNVPERRLPRLPGSHDWPAEASRHRRPLYPARVRFVSRGRPARVRSAPRVDFRPCFASFPVQGRRVFPAVAAWGRMFAFCIRWMDVAPRQWRRELRRSWRGRGAGSGQGPISAYRMHAGPWAIWGCHRPPEKAGRAPRTAENAVLSVDAI